MMELKKDPHPLFRRSQFYQYVCNLRDPFGVDAMIHLNYRYGRENHKVEIIDAGDKTLDEMAGIITQLFDIDPWRLRVMRTDLAADVDGAPVHWFKNSAHIDRKQFSSSIEKSFERELQFVSMGSAVAQTLYAGKRPNLYRIYDKLAEWRIQYRKIVQDYQRFNERMAGMDMTGEQRYFGQRCPPTFHEYCETFGYDFQPGNVLTRVERQIGGRVPPEFATLADLRHAHELDPFTALQIIPSAKSQILDPPAENVSVRNWLAALGFESVKQQFGSAQLARQFVLKHGKNNGKRILESLLKSMPRSRAAVTREGIVESYRLSTLAQTSPREGNQVYLSPTYERKRKIAGSSTGVLSQEGTNRRPETCSQPES
jgi:hypothetical protein